MGLSFLSPFFFEEEGFPSIWKSGKIFFWYWVSQSVRRKFPVGEILAGRIEFFRGGKQKVQAERRKNTEK